MEKERIEMKCLIISAGKGSRLLKNKIYSKPLAPILGLPIIERIILTAKNSGFTDIYVVSGYNCEKLSGFLTTLSRSRDINITNIINNEWEKGNGLSVLKANNLLKEDFILLMGDHIFDGNIIKRLKNERVSEGEVILAVDYNVNANPMVDLDDVTKIFANNGKITDIGKSINSYNAFDTGIFLCSTAIFPAIQKSIAYHDDDSLSGGIRILAKEGHVRAFDVKEGFWIDIDDENTFQKAEGLLLNRLTKSDDGLISRHINRKVSTKIFTPLLLKIRKGITPNHVSILGFITALISSLFFFLGHAITGALFIQLSSILDGCDGEIARLKEMQSTFGNFIDAILDRYADGLIFLGIFCYLLSQLGNKEVFGINSSSLIIAIICVLAILGNIMVSYTSAKSVVNFGYRYKGKLIAAGRGRDLRLFILFIGGIMTYFHPIFILIALLVIAIQTNTIVLCRTYTSWVYNKKKDIVGMVNKTKAVIFDFDGTIANTMPFLTELAINLITEKFDISKEDAKKRYLETSGVDFATQVKSILPNHPENRDLVDTFESKKTEGIFNQPIFRDTIFTLNYCKEKKIKTFICSSTHQDIVKKYCQMHGIEALVDGIFGYKPDFGKYEQIDFIIQYLKLPLQEILFVGDSLRDYDFIKEEKMNFIGISKIFSKLDFQRRELLSVACLTELVKIFKMSVNFHCFEEAKLFGYG